MGVHFWLPKAHVEASTRGSMVLAGVLLKLGAFGIVRLIITFNLNLSIWFWLLGSFIARILTTLQSDIKKLVALRRVTHITFIMMRLAYFNKCSILVIVLISLAHG